MQSKIIRTYLDPDAVGPLPRSVTADDSDEVAAAKTLIRIPDPTQELTTDDFIDPEGSSRRFASLTPVGYETGALRPYRARRRLAPLALGVVLLAGAILVAAAFVGSSPRARSAPASAAARALTSATSAPSVGLPPAAPPANTLGVLRLDPGADGQRLRVDGVMLTLPAAVVACGPHDVAVGATGASRTIDVPCGGEVTVFR
jgi:hypothetical protein